MAADQGALAAGVAPVEPAPVFALTPALVGQDFLDWTKHGNSKLHQKAIEKLLEHQVRRKSGPDSIARKRNDQ